MPDMPTDITKAAKDLAGAAKDATYVVIGAGVIGFQKAQVQRQELGKRLADPKSAVTTVRTNVSTAIQGMDLSVDGVAEQIEQLIEKFEQTVAPLEEKLPSKAQDLTKQAHVQAKQARMQIRSLIPS